FEGKVDIKVYDAMGNLIDSFVTFNDMDSKTLEYNLRARKGIYFLVANGKGGTIAKKVIIR
ncbi:MAG: T9SS type A sorting domain-containing protein, partial [Prevotella sp.]|nr:T9SS type A sorting domain-containing protein [Prevotella sp.]